MSDWKMSTIASGTSNPPVGVGLCIIANGLNALGRVRRLEHCEKGGTDPASIVFCYTHDLSYFGDIMELPLSEEMERVKFREHVEVKPISGFLWFCVIFSLVNFLIGCVRC